MKILEMGETLKMEDAESRGPTTGVSSTSHYGRGSGTGTAADASSHRTGKEKKKCGVCGDVALGSNFNAITCESCKADITLRPPPPSYQASMQEYRLRLLLMDRQSPPASHPPPPQPPPPPPIYRGPATVYPRFPVNIGISDYSRPPSYRSRPSSAGQPSPVGPEDGELINNSTSSSHHLPSDVISPVSASQSAMRPAPSVGAASNHVEVVAQV